MIKVVKLFGILELLVGLVYGFKGGLGVYGVGVSYSTSYYGFGVS